MLMSLLTIKYVRAYIITCIHICKIKCLYVYVNILIIAIKIIQLYSHVYQGILKYLVLGHV